MNEQHLKNVVEAALLAAGRPLSIEDFAALFAESQRPAKAEVQAALTALEADYASRGIEIKETAAGFRVQVRRDLAEEISRLWPERPARYSRALLETLALIAYRQPITRGEIEAVRGVAVNPNIVRTLLERNWIRVVGQREVPGRPELLGTTREFLDYFGLKSLEELPPLEELQAMADFNVQLELDAPPRHGENGAGENAAGENGSAEAPAAEHELAAESGSASEPDYAPESDSAAEPDAGPKAGPEENASEDPGSPQELVAAPPEPR